MEILKSILTNVLDAPFPSVVVMTLVVYTVDVVIMVVYLG